MRNIAPFSVRAFMSRMSGLYISVAALTILSFIFYALVFQEEFIYCVVAYVLMTSIAVFAVTVHYRRKYSRMSLGFDSQGILSVNGCKCQKLLHYQFGGDSLEITGSFDDEVLTLYYPLVFENESAICNYLDSYMMRR